jgi:hypothetical protein
MALFQRTLYVVIAICMVVVQSIGLSAEQIPVRHIEGESFGFLALRSIDRKVLAYGLVGPLKHPPPQVERRLHARVCRPALSVLLRADAASQSLERVVFVRGRVSIA